MKLPSIKRSNPGQPNSRMVPILTVLAIAGIGVLTLVLSHAATSPPIVLGMDVLKPQGAAQQVADSSALNGQTAIQFGGSTSGNSGGGTTTVSGSSKSCYLNNDNWGGNADGYKQSSIGTDGTPASGFTVTLTGGAKDDYVQGYPSLKCLLWDTSIPANLTSTFSITPPATSSSTEYEFAYDIWIAPASYVTQQQQQDIEGGWENEPIELMIWNYNNNQWPSSDTDGATGKTISDPGAKDDGSQIWYSATEGNGKGVISIIYPSSGMSNSTPAQPRVTSDTVNISKIITQLQSDGYIPSSYNGILDVEYGIEAPVNGSGLTYKVNSLTVNQ